MNNNTLSKNMVDKSIEAFLMGLEIYNKPTIKYRVEGFSFLFVTHGNCRSEEHTSELQSQR